MMHKIGFYAPMKSPNHPNPSGDRTIARALLQALNIPETSDVCLMSELRCRDGKGNVNTQNALLSEAQKEIERITASDPPDCWVTYHNYYKAPDLIGPAVSKHFNIPYIQIESTRSPKRLSGPWANFAEKAETAADAADIIFYFTERDKAALTEYKTSQQTLHHLRPFLPISELPKLTLKINNPPRMITVAMMREGDKTASYINLAHALKQVRFPYQLTVIGDGNTAGIIKDALPDHTDYLGAIDNRQKIIDEYQKADVFLWPGINEAFGMVYLEAQCNGLPVIAEDRMGVRDVVRDGGILTPPNDGIAYASAIDQLLNDANQRQKLAISAQNQMKNDHLLHSAQQTLWQVLAPMLGSR